uniref:Uncharacterized protein n=1 Tax=Percolomonas cosmopolitus TaxID=63605 RepID=A0A6U0JYL4_9EUKA|mmetsp:Transcript_1754/g.6179  ORF Transcript_1754/g.6179 Transcript_1754/m.6179 type:complete len:528 (-) Transcript_1754:4055-5638(-)
MPSPSASHKRKRVSGASKSAHETEQIDSRATGPSKTETTSTGHTSQQPARKRRKLNYGTGSKKKKQTSTHKQRVGSTPQQHNTSSNRGITPNIQSLTKQKLASLSPQQHYQQLRHLLNSILMLQRLHATTPHFSRLDHFTNAIMQAQSHNRQTYPSNRALLHDLQILEFWDVLNVVQIEEPKKASERMRVVRVETLSRAMPKMVGGDASPDGVHLPTEDELKQTVLHRALNDPIISTKKKDMLLQVPKEEERAHGKQQQNGANNGTTTAEGNETPRTPTSPTTPISKGTPLHSPYSRANDPLTKLNRHNFRLFQYYKELEDICLHVLLAFQSVSRNGLHMATRLPLVDLLGQIAALHENRPTKQKLLKHVLHLTNEAPEYLALFFRESNNGEAKRVEKCSLKEEASVSSLLQRPLADMHIVVNGGGGSDAVLGVVFNTAGHTSPQVTNTNVGDVATQENGSTITEPDEANTSTAAAPQEGTTASTESASLVLRPHDLVVEVFPKQFSSTQVLLRKRKEEHRAKSHIV